MRKELIKHQDKKLFIIGTIERYGLKKQYIGGETPTMLLKNVKIEEEIIDHLWINVGKTLSKLNIREGSIISFEAWIKGYYKGYIENLNFNETAQSEQALLVRKQYDLGINRLSKINILNINDQGMDFKEFWQNKKQTHFLSQKY